MNQNFLSEVLADFFWFSHDVKQRDTEFECRPWNTSTSTLPIDSNDVNCQDLARVVPVLVTRCPYCAFWPFCFPLFPVIICTCASFPLIVFKPLVFLSSLLCVCMLAPSPSHAVTLRYSGFGLLYFWLFFWGLFFSLLFLPLCGFSLCLGGYTFLSLGITFDVVDLYFCLKIFFFIKSLSLVLLCLPHLLGSADY